jgi:hypothetical protein
MNYFFKTSILQRTNSFGKKILLHFASIFRSYIILLQKSKDNSDREGKIERDGTEWDGAHYFFRNSQRLYYQQIEPVKNSQTNLGFLIPFGRVSYSASFTETVIQTDEY